MIHILYFASLRERVGTGAEELSLEDSGSVADILTRLRLRGGAWADALDPSQTVLAAVNQDMARLDTPVQDGDEVAFFPPVTGG
ncbi:MAG: molybdopterin converting factor subunit 1 [Thiohalocapsa sp.]